MSALPRLVPVTPTGSRAAAALVMRSGPRGRVCSQEVVALDTYPPSPEGEELRRVRVHEADLTLREAARCLGITPSELSALERGSARFEELAGWAAARELMLRR